MKVKRVVANLAVSEPDAAKRFYQGILGLDEPWGVRRFFVRGPFGNLVNILVHE